MELPILYEDDDFLVVNKLPGVVVNRAESVKGETVQEWMENRFPSSFWQAQRARPESQRDAGQASMTMQSEQDFISRAGIVHRIDKETSGILLIAKNPAAFIELQRQFKERIVKKTYLAIVHGKLVPAEGEIRAPVGRLPWNRERFGIVPGGKEAVTRYRVVKSLSVSGNSGNPKDSRNLLVSLVELYPETGRTHQIRVHLKYVNHPILSDFLYAGRKTSRNDRKWAPRVMLHAWKISFRHPTTGKEVAIESPIPDDMKRIIEQY